jgi:hypothetical protein
MGPALTSTSNPVGGALIQAAGAYAGRKAEEEREAEAAQARADRVTIAKAGTKFRAELAEFYDGEATGYDGSSPGFAERFDEQSQRLLDQQLGAADGRYAQELELRLQGVRGDFQLSALRFERDKQEAYTLKGISEIADTEAKAVYRDPSLYGQALETLDEVAEAVPEGLRPKFMAEARGAYALSALSAYELNDPTTGLRLLQGGAFDDALDAEEVVKASSSLQAEIGRREAAAQREADKRQRQVEAQLKSELGQIDFAREHGLPVSDERWQRSIDLASQSGDEAVANVVRMRRADRNAGALKEMPLAEALGTVDQLRARLEAGADVEAGAAEELVAAEKVVAGMGRALREDPVAFFMAEDPDFAPLSLDDSLSALKSRVAMAEERAEHYGVPARYFAEDELSLLTDQLSRDPAQAMAFMQAAAAAGRPEMMGEIAPKAPALAHGAGLMQFGGDKAFVARMLDGEARRRKGADQTVPKNEMPLAAEEIFGNAFQYTPDFVPSAMAAAALAYDADSAQSGRTRDDFDADQYEWALQQAAGARAINGVRHGGVTVIRHGSRQRHVVVPPDMTPQAFTRRWKEMPDDVFSAGLSGVGLSRDGREIPMAELRKGLPVSVGPGRYRIELAPGEFAGQEDGRFLTFSMEKIRPHYSQGENNGD